jgi:hypothetical protein
MLSTYIRGEQPVTQNDAILGSVADPGSGAFSTPGSGIRDGKISDLGSAINIPDPQHW